MYETTPKLPKAGAVEYWPRKWNPMAEGTMKRMAEIPARTANALGKSCGLSISEMKVGNRIWGTQMKVMFITAFIQATHVVPGRGKAYVFTGPSVG